MNTEQLAVFVIPQQIMKKGQGHLQITDIPLIRCPQGYMYLDFGQMMRICLVKIPFHSFRGDFTLCRPVMQILSLTWCHA